MKKLLMYIACVILAVAVTPLLFVFTVGALIVLAKTGGDLDAMTVYEDKFTETIKSAVGWFWDLF